MLENIDIGEKNFDNTKHHNPPDASDEPVFVPLQTTPLDQIFAEAEAQYPAPLGLEDILSIQDFAEAEKRVDAHVMEFNRRYGLDGWDYAIASSCGLFAAMLDIFFVSAPLKPTADFSRHVDGLFNRGVQEAFNKIIPPDISKKLSKKFPIGAPDTSIITDLIGAPDKVLNPTNHRLRSLAHDPLLGLFFGIFDMINGTCTTVVDGKILSIPSLKGTSEGNLFQLIGRMLGHLLSDVNAPTANGNRGMGLPAPFMGLLRMFEKVPVGDSNFGRQIEWMFANGYDFRQFAATSVPMLIMETLVRVFYTIKQMKIHGASFGETILDTMPARINPRFRIMLAISYGASSAVNAGKIYVTGNILNANYASWMGLTWNGFHALKWSLLQRHLNLWSEVEAKEISELENLVSKIDGLGGRAGQLPISQ
ncbi:hypothetical protein AA0229_1824 [Gluconobacter cerinus NRIC 0229]|nr:hypothetical protein AA0229_1824 [Gluconobacter cerinus NRIC 0229]